MKRHFLLPIAALMAAGMMFVGCKKDESDDVKISHKDSAKVIEVMTKSRYDIAGYHTPRDGEKDIHLGAELLYHPGVALNAPFEVTIPGDITFTYRYELTSCTLTDPSGANLVTEYKYNEQDSSISIAHKTFASETQYNLSTTITLMQQTNGAWQPVVYNGKAMDYELSSNFTTGTAAEAIRPDDILYSYPIDRQLNYMPKEYTEGYIMLNYKYPELFDGIAANDMKVVVKNITDDTKVEQTTTFSVKESHEVDGEVAELGYSLKDIMFDPNQIYSLAFFCGEKQVHQIYFRTSFYETLKSKLEHFEWDNTTLKKSSMDALRKEMHQRIPASEQFDIFEAQTTNLSYEPANRIRYTADGNLDRCLIYITADLENCAWYQNSIFKQLYNNYSLDYNDAGRIVKYPPIDAYEILLYDSYKKLSDNDINSKKVDVVSTYSCVITSYLVFFMDNDVRKRGDILRMENESTLSALDKQIKDYYEPPFYSIGSGDYPYFISFRLPGKNIITYTERHVMTL